ncbi:MAG: enoyl-CoA hydratase-related protein [Pseudomonadota bacterium]
MITANRPAITLDISNGIARIVLNRPDDGNAIGVDFIEALDRVSLECTERTDLRAVVISAQGRHFCVGGDIHAMTSGKGGLSLAGYIHKCNSGLESSLARLEHLDAPTMAIVQGTAAGGGVSLLAACDIVVSANQAKFVAAYAGIGYCPDMGGSTVLTRRMGMTRARRFYLLNETLNSDAALEAGLVDIVSPLDRLEAEAQTIFDRWAMGPTLAYGAIRRLMRSSTTTPYEAQIRLETQELTKLARSADANEALRAFVERRPARFQGR